ncbi:MAG: SDR family oxidoreductase [Caldilinea sp. CFX5]|nr:SDR family oxidoreductase [Caldilinea sp. CFX5]
MELQGKVALVTGGSGGIGRAIAQRLAHDGALVAVHYGHNAETARQTVQEIAANGGAAFAVQADLAEVAQIERLYQALDRELEQRTGGKQLDILVNNAGISALFPYQQMTPAQFDQLFAVNVRGAFFLTQMALSRLRDGGRIINISSDASKGASPPISVAYSMSKAALDAFTISLAADLGKRQITANTIAPGATETEMNADMFKDPAVRKQVASMTALGRLGTSTDIANVVALLASADSAWITGQYIVASGGLRL